MRSFVLAFFLATVPLSAWAIDAPSGQVPLDGNKVLRGNFVEEHQVNATKDPIHTSGHFLVAPANGLIWNIEQPFPTATVITPKGMVQEIGGIALKLPSKNLRHLFNTVEAALAGDWSGLEKDFVITRKDNAKNWQMILTPRHNEQATLPYTSITISGSRFVENITTTRPDGSFDTLSFTDETMSSAPLEGKEVVAFNKAAQASARD